MWRYRLDFHPPIFTLLSILVLLLNYKPKSGKGRRVYLLYEIVGAVRTQVWKLEARQSTSQHRWGTGRARFQWVDCAGPGPVEGEAGARLPCCRCSWACLHTAPSARSLISLWKIVHNKKLACFLSSKACYKSFLTVVPWMLPAEMISSHHVFFMSLKVTFPYEYIVLRILKSCMYIKNTLCKDKLRKKSGKCQQCAKEASWNFSLVTLFLYCICCCCCSTIFYIHLLYWDFYHHYNNL